MERDDKFAICLVVASSCFFFLKSREQGKSMGFDGFVEHASTLFVRINCNSTSSWTHSWFSLLACMSIEVSPTITILELVF